MIVSYILIYKILVVSLLASKNACSLVESLYIPYIYIQPLELYYNLNMIITIYCNAYEIILLDYFCYYY